MRHGVANSSSLARSQSIRYVLPGGTERNGIYLILLDVLNNYDELDPTAVPLARRRIASESWRRVVSSGSSLEGLVIGVPKVLLQHMTEYARTDQALS
jgi:hypothetical protein